ncbi:MAG: RidA family protein [Alphaproteobacteria bacterium]|nr:RidA family protein [Alphaproteobacteria bacterium]
MAKVTIENPPGTAPAQGLYSHVGIIHGGKVACIAGQLAVDMDGAVVGKGDFSAQFACVFKNLGDVLKGLGADWSAIAKFTTYLVHSQDIEKFMKERAALFPKLFGQQPYPPNTLLIVDRLVKEDFLVEVEAIAAIDR